MDSKEATIKKMGQELVGYAGNHVVGIAYTLEKESDGAKIRIGSGFYTTIAGQTGWVTARHVIEDIRREFERGNLLGNALLYSPYDIGSFLFGLPKDYFDKNPVIFGDSNLDVAFVPLPEKAIEKIKIAGINQIEQTRLYCPKAATSGILIAYGFISQLSKIAKDGLLDYVSKGKKRTLSQLRLKETAMQGVLLFPKPKPESFSTFNHDSTTYEMVPQIANNSLTDTRGMSGGPILYFDSEKTSSISDFQLFGIQSSQIRVGEKIKSMKFCNARLSLESFSNKIRQGRFD